LKPPKTGGNKKKSYDKNESSQNPIIVTDPATNSQDFKKDRIKKWVPLQIRYRIKEEVNLSV
jgi:hypothetical protein